MRLWDIPRNDIEACRRLWMERDVTPDDWRVMLRLQDDPAQLIAAEKRWRKRVDVPR